MPIQKLKQHKYLPYFILLFLAFVWGSSFILIKKGLDSFSPIQVGSIRVVFAFLVLLPFAVRRIKSVFVANWQKIILFGLIANLIPAILYGFAQTGLSSSLTGILNSLTPIFTLLIGLMFFQTKLNKGQVVGLIFGFVGCIVISIVSASGNIGEFNHFVVFVVIATVLYGIATNMVKSLFVNIDSLTLTSLAFLGVGPIALIILLSTDFITVFNTNSNAAISLFYLFILGVIGTAFSLILFNKLIQITSAVFASTVTYLIPIAAIAWGLIDDEVLFPLHFIGMGLIIGGVYVVNKFK
jgi:drug/metabolite transporter (DMT)-like permease